jgi:hypothetical protein
MDTGAADAADGGATDAGGGTVVTVDVVSFDPYWVDFSPLEDAQVRVDGADGTTTEGTTDAMGRAIVRVPEGSGPWTVTAARPGYSVVSLLDVDGPIESPLRLLPTTTSPPATRTVSGSIMGAVPSAVGALGPGVRSFSPAGASTYTLEMADRAGAGLVRVMALEAGPFPYNAAWVDIDLSATDLSGIDIAFPSPARAVATSSMSLVVPTTGVVDASAFTLASSGAVHTIDGFPFPVGTAQVTAATGGTYSVEIEALTGDMAPTQIRVELTDGAQLGVAVFAPFADGSTFTIPPAAALEATGTNLGDVRLTMDAPMHDYTGAVVRNWRVYTFGSGGLVDEPWPELPSGMTAADVPLSPTSTTLALVASSFDDGVAIWDTGSAARTSVAAISRTSTITLVGR